MNEIKKITVISVIVFLFLIAEIPVASSSTILSYSYPTTISSISPKIVYNNSTNFPPLWWTNLNSYKDQAYMNITSIWSSGITCDDNGNVFWTDTFGNVSVAWVRLNYAISYLGSPYSRGFSYAGPITSIAAVNFTYKGTSYQYVVVLTYNGYVFGYNIATNGWFNATSHWNLPLTQYPTPWTSVTSNTEGINSGYYEDFFFTDLYGNVYIYNVTSPNHSGWLLNKYTTSSNLKIISNAVSYEDYMYSISYNGTVYVYTSSGWSTYDSTGINGLISIAISYTNSGGYLFLLQINNGTTLYESSNTAGSPKNSFSSYGTIIFSKGTNEALTIDRHYRHHGIFWAIQTNGTIAGSSNPNNGWSYSNNLLPLYIYNVNMLSLNSSYSSDFMAYANYIMPTNNSYSNMLNFTLYFNGSDNKMNLEYYYQPGSSKNPANPALLTNSRGLIINVTLMPNTSYNSYFNFNVIIYPQNNPNSVIFVYILDIRIINHFSYIPLGG